MQSPQKKFGEQLAIQKHSILDGDDHSLDLRFDLRPDFPSHVPTPETIDRVDEPTSKLGRIQHRLQNKFAADDDEAMNRIRTQRGKDKSPPIKSTPSTVVPSGSPLASGKLKVLITSPVGTKWGSDVWNTIKMNSHINESPETSSPKSRRSSESRSSVSSLDETRLALLLEVVDRKHRKQHIQAAILRDVIDRKQQTNKRPSSPSSNVGSSNRAKKQSTCSTYDGRPSTQNEVTVERIVCSKTAAVTKTKSNNANANTSNKTPSVSRLQQKWMEENALNLHFSCREEAPQRRSSFLRLNRTPLSPTTYLG